MVQLLPITIVLLPLLAAAVNGLFCRNISHCFASTIGSISMLIAAICASMIFYRIATGGDILHITLFQWLEVDSLRVNFVIYVDQLTSIMFLTVTIVSAVVHIYSIWYMHDDKNLPKFMCFLSLFTFFMLALVCADNFLQLFFGWEGVGLCSYLLIGYWHHKTSANKAAIKAFITNRVSDCAFIVAIGLLVIYTKSFDFGIIFQDAPNHLSNMLNIYGIEFTQMDVICLLLFFGCMGKSAQIGLHIWLPDAMEGPTPVSALIHAATMVTAGVFLLARCSYLFEYSRLTLNFIAIIGGITCFFAAQVALAQTDIKKIIAYSTCSQLGYMFVACGVSAYNAGIFHLVTHASFKALLFLCAGNVIHASNEQDISKIGGIRKKMPITYTYFIIASIAITGIFPLSGFYSKDLILESALIAGNIGEIVYYFGIITAILTAIYSMKIIILVFHGNTCLSSKNFAAVHEVGKIANIPLIILALGSIFAGYVGFEVLHINSIPGYFGSSIYGHDAGAEHAMTFILRSLPLIAGIIGLIIGIYIYKCNLHKVIANKCIVVGRILRNKYYFDELYDCIFIKPIGLLVQIAHYFDKHVIDQCGPGGSAKLSNLVAWSISKMHTGYIFNYVFVIISSIVIYMTFLVIDFTKIT